jgi:aryl-alcohol dehydrogenase-like predicted oxidoreductase
LEQRNLGRSGLKVSLVGLGCNNFAGRIDFDATRRSVHKALDLGITLFDNADTYGERGGAEEYLGKILGPRRKEIVLATKFGRPMDAAGKLQGASRGYVMDAVEASLRRLQTDYIDLYWQHIEDPLTPMEETLLDPRVLASRRGGMDGESARPRTFYRLPGALQPAGARI